MLLLSLAACLDNTPIPGGDTFIALQSDFAGFQDWDATDVDSADTGHVAGERVVYLNSAPDPGADAFPTGTILVKTIAWSGGLDVHAMVKRGSGFNPDGAVGWEWFELALDDDGTPIIQWRGTEPPAGEAYGTLPGANPDSGATITGDCNTCHASAARNDYVHTVPVDG